MIITGIQFLDTLLYAYLILSVGYLFLFAIASLFSKERQHPQANEYMNFVILIPSYKEDQVIIETARAAIKQHYPTEHFSILIISDQMNSETNNSLRLTGVNVLEIHCEESTKAKALQSGIRLLSQPDYKGIIADYIIVLDADNLIAPDYLEQINRYLQSVPCKALQTHRTAKNLNTPTAILDATIEEMNNSIFRLGHVKLGLSSALIGSGMVIEYAWFAKNIFQVHTAGEDKELEELLLRQRISIHYTDSIRLFDEKVQQKEAMRNQRKRWIATQFFLAGRMWPHVPHAFYQGNWDYIVKAIQSIILPRSILMGIIGVIAFITTFIPFISCIKWWCLLLILIISLYIAIPQSMRNKEFYNAFMEVPYFIISMMRNLFHSKGASKKFIHTSHGEKLSS